MSFEGWRDVGGNDAETTRKPCEQIARADGGRETKWRENGPCAARGKGGGGGGGEAEILIIIVNDFLNWLGHVIM